MMSNTHGLSMDSSTNMMVVDSACLTGGLLYSMSLSSASMRCRVSSETPERPLMTLETVDGVVFASLAMCDSFGRWLVDCMLFCDEGDVMMTV